MLSDIPIRYAQAIVEFDQFVVANADPARVIRDWFMNTRLTALSIETVNPPWKRGMDDMKILDRDRQIRMRVELKVQLRGNEKVREFIERCFVGMGLKILEVR